ncbi:MAG: hypothetical protein EBU90_20465 [Proteobacteria bacterium]|nr:hypothetical protein [Pseudomonadota bacterium]
MKVMRIIAGIVGVGSFLSVINLLGAVSTTAGTPVTLTVQPEQQAAVSVTPPEKADEVNQPTQVVGAQPVASNQSTVSILPAANPPVTVEPQTMQSAVIVPVEPQVNQPVAVIPSGSVVQPTQPFTVMPVSSQDTQKPLSVVRSLPGTKEEKVNPIKSQPIMPEKHEDHTQQVDEVDGQVEDKDLRDTVDSKATSGNWVYKNYWWRKIEELYSQIKEAFNRVMTTRMTFFNKRNEVDKELDRFYQHVGLEQGPLEDIINLGIAVIEKEKKDQGFLDKKERIFFDKIKDKQTQLEQLKVDIKAVVELDHKIDEALEVVLQQVDICSKYEQEAWSIFKNVARELSDKEARKQYYDTKGLLQDVNKVHEYLTGPFTSYFEQMAQSVQEHTQSIISRLAVLKNDQLDLKKEADFFEKEDEALEKKHVAIKHEAEEKKDVVTERVGIVAQISQWITSLPMTFYSAISALGTNISGLFGSSEKVVKTVESNVTAEEKKAEDVIQKTDQSIKKEVE